MNSTLLNSFEEYLANCLEYLEDSRVKEAMQYALHGKGKRIRPMLFLRALEEYGYDSSKYLPVACAIEMIHTYSLVHDDLPAMDDDDLRRGRATVHKAFDEATAILAGDGLLSEAFHLITSVECLESIKVQMIQETVRACGCRGMILGQEIDLFADTHTDLQRMDALKTGAMFGLPLILAALIAQDRETIQTWRELGSVYGVYFQIQDDLLEVESTSEMIGKTSNKESDKENYINRYGVQRCKEILKELEDRIASYETSLINRKGIFALLKETYDRKY
ncbi:MAG: polyprenyl synthetase family protein [Erysipelotrichaceae bacterium]|nr:polyprenyl synthetase family protein [Erysipelotrichaceae bacterium]MBR3694435.1 polyprenyl synthetase family protein [Erysipelotrichales bacterium]